MLTGSRVLAGGFRSSYVKQLGDFLRSRKQERLPFCISTICLFLSVCLVSLSVNRSQTYFVFGDEVAVRLLVSCSCALPA